MFLFNQKKSQPKELLQEVLTEILEVGKFSLSFQIEEKEGCFYVDIFGKDESFLKSKNGKLLQALQTLLSRVLYKQFFEEGYKIKLDSNGFWQEKESQLLYLVDDLIKQALDDNKPVFLKKPLSPYERRLIHEKVSGNTGVRSESLGDGVYKTMKLIPDTYISEK